jgi:formyltetrahydrofolate synthetase
MQAVKDLQRIGSSAWGRVCAAKTTVALARPLLRNPVDFSPARARMLRAGAGFVVVLCGDMQRMRAWQDARLQNIDIDANGQTVGLF